MIKVYRKARNTMRAHLPTDVRLSERLRSFREMGVENAMRSPENYDDLPNEPSKSMEIDPFKQPYSDPFDFANKMHTDFAKADALANKASESDGQQDAAGAQHTEGTEVND